MKNIAVLVLAAGKSSRMGCIKQLEKINNKTLLDITLEKTKQLSVKNIFCVLGANADKIKENIVTTNITYIYNKKFETGLSSSIVAGIQYFNKKKLNFKGVFIVLADQPAIHTKYLKTMFDVFDEHKSKIIASKYGNKLGVPAIFPKNYFNDLLQIKGDKGAKEFINQRKEEVVCTKITSNLFDIDTIEDLKLYKKSILK